MILGEGKTECAQTKKKEREGKKARLGEHKSVK